MEQTNKKHSFDIVKAGFVTISIIGCLLILGAAGEMDYNDAARCENQNLGYEKNIIEDDHTLSKAFLGSLLLAGGAFGCYKRNQKAR